MPKFSVSYAWVGACVVAMFFAMSLALQACEEKQEKAKDYEYEHEHTSYRDIPGITSEEIDAIDKLKSNRASFVYGTNPSTESFLDKDGKISGFSLLFCNWLSNFFGIPFEPALYEWGDLVSGLESGKIDFTGDLTPTAERRKAYAMTDDPIVVRPLVTIRIRDSEILNDIAKHRPLRFAFLDGTTTIEDVLAAMNHDTIETILVEDYAEAYEKLKSGEADVFFDEKTGEAAFDSYEDLEIEDFLPLIYSPVSFSTHNKELQPFISAVQKVLQCNEGKRSITKMYNEGYNEYLKHKFFNSLTEEEREYIKRQHVVPFAAEPNNYPISFYDIHAKEWHGVAIDVIKIIESLTDMKFKIVNDKNASWPVMLKMLEDGEVFIVSELIYSESREGEFLWPKTNFMTDRYALISKESHHNISINEISYTRIGMARNTAYTEAFKRWFPSHSNNVEFDDQDEAFKALRDDEVDMVISSLHQFLKITNYLELVDYKANYVFDYTYKSTFGINKNQALLCSIIDKAFNQIDIRNISERWMYKTYDYRVKLANARVPWIIGAAVLLSILGVMFILIKTKQNERVRLESIAQKRTAEIFAIYTSIPDTIFTMSKELLYTSCNHAFEAFAGKSLDDIIGKTDYEVFGVDRDMVDYFVRVNKQVIENMETVIVQEIVTDASGIEKIMETIKAPLFQNGVLSGLIGISRDITAHKKAEEEALDASMAKSTFLANMSHEIRTPMNAIIGMAELLTHENLNSRQMNYVKDISLSASSLLSIINDVLDMSKIESGKLALAPVDYNFLALADNVKSMFRFVARKKGVEFIYECASDVPECLFGDDIRLRQVLTNICGNAVKFTERGHVKLKIYTRDKSLVIEVSDTGMGIHEEDIPKLFNAFSQADTIKNRGIVGTGLGLSICKSFIEMMGGSVSVSSEYGKGTVFAVAIPLVLGNKDNLEYSEDDTKKQNLEAPSASILVVDDNEFNLKVACGLLGLLKIDAKTASSGKEAIELVKNNKFDIIFMDHMMPEMDGIEATSKIRDLGGEYEKIPIIALTANAIQGAREMFLSSGFNGFISKPIEVHILNAIILEWLPPEKVSISEGKAKDEKNEVAPDAAKELSFLEALGNIEEINAEIGLNRFSGIESMYFDTFKLFHKKIIEECDKMSIQLSSGDIHAFAISVHAMKSALATVGAMGLSEMALKQEMAAKSDDADFCAEHYPDLDERLRLLYEKLLAVFPLEEVAAEKKAGDQAYLKENIQKALVAAGDFDNYTGMELVKKLLAYDYGEEINALLEATVTAFNELNFEGAAENLNKINS